MKDFHQIRRKSFVIIGKATVALEHTGHNGRDRPPRRGAPAAKPRRSPRRPLPC
jgi:hypothetical protein